ncbi:receptor expression-enhancing protein 2-like [Sycon ciliatum]|uniref:receptor expression-enhancing protein 2-like n=1 Tax=Sycon ciliatum TaxID=27933 RepID=UPI0020ABB37A|eukprot:scpid62416/ scgid35123/ Receptor expression-enhancing protein 2
MLSQLFSRVLILGLGTLYPAYSSYKAVRTKNVREYVKWMMYWVVFAFFTTAETFGDIFLSWVPLYYEIKILFLIWLLAPATKGSSILYRKFVHPYLMKNEREIDNYIERASQNGVGLLRRAGQRGLQAVATGMVQSNVVSMGQVYFQQQLQQIIPATEGQNPAYDDAQLHTPAQQSQQQQEQQSSTVAPAAHAEPSMHHTDPAAAAAAAAVPAGTHVDGGASDHPPPYAATVSSRPPIKTEPALDDMSGGSGQFVPLTPPLNRSRPTSGANANVTGAAATTAAGNRRTTKTAGARASSTTAKSRTRATTSGAQTRKGNP